MVAFPTLRVSVSERDLGPWKEPQGPPSIGQSCSEPLPYLSSVKARARWRPAHGPSKAEGGSLVFPTL